MKSVKYIVALVAVCFMPMAMAEKIAVLGVQEALLASKAAGSFRDSLKKELSGEEKRVVDLEKQAKGLREKIQKNGSSMSQEQLNQSRLQFQKAFEEYQRSGQALQQKRIEREQSFIEDMRPKLDVVIRKIIEENGYDVVLAKQATVYTAKGVDITPRVVELLNKQ
ncbi:OmpH family outer membrane protein [Neptunomonas phycophila]|jgi:outer membrane protein|uniref:OmpH family outer membrane protein n=1 Tax=Neptunomonas phycophila TaxID=1572645 RepID=A0AAW7XPL4_9GAMM|nr:MULTISPECIES: OmpH family outer membrane protein [Neptunomonas]MBT3144450.1 OmpH family outer membrane protein [Neptunomonas phycophila]MDN2660596.1 OmpH family outer membrane protein [Neptunomonas sp. CHC150]MDO6454927.1 OmpH family outer membrane protein [Neptunomonas phycophila]MDO6468146.1 OmpH family outer membrane protein [Neptunomonas phycophila]MDO6784201.1 OmpH family outer membrane protein [Neptunomonas phycophila]